jgi:hypothetical protein
MRALGLCALLVAGSAACGPAPHTRAAGAVSPLAVRAVDWNPSNAAVGNVHAVADTGDVVAVFSDRGATVFAARAPVATDASVKDWTGAAAIAGADGTAQWIVGVSGNGRLYHLRGLSAFEDVTGRYALGASRVHGVTPLGGGAVGFFLGHELAIADGAQVARYSTDVAGAAFDDLVGGAGFGAVLGRGGVRLFDVAHKTIAEYPLPGVTHAALGPNGRLYAATPRAVYAADSSGKLALVYDATGDAIHGLVASGSLVWFADGEELGVVEGDHVAETTGAKLGRAAKLESSSSGDVWVLSGGGLARFARTDGVSSVAGAWASEIGPIFARSCSTCHLPDGVSGTDLSAAPAWEAERAEIRERVVEKKTMPPPGHPLSAEDREVIRNWVEGPKPPEK